MTAQNINYLEHKQIKNFELKKLKWPNRLKIKTQQ